MLCPKTRMNAHFFVSTNFVCNLLLQLTGFLLQLTGFLLQLTGFLLQLYASKTPRAGRIVLFSAGRFAV